MTRTIDPAELAPAPTEGLSYKHHEGEDLDVERSLKAAGGQALDEDLEARIQAIREAAAAELTEHERRCDGEVKAVEYALIDDHPTPTFETTAALRCDKCGLMATLETELPRPTDER